LVAFLYAQLFGFNGFRPYTETWKAVMAVNSLVFFAMFCFWSFQSSSAQTKLILFGMAPLLLFFLTHYIIPDQTIEVKSPGTILEQHVQNIAPDSVIISDEESIGAVCWYLQRNDVYLLGGAGELGYGLTNEDARGRLLDPKSAATLMEENPGKGILIGRVRNVSRWRDQLPQPVFQDQNGPSGYVFWKY
jgi:4-amino-4-deoxy-L-arabinose transferase